MLLLPIELYSCCYTDAFATTTIENLRKFLLGLDFYQFPNQTLTIEHKNMITGNTVWKDIIRKQLIARKFLTDNKITRFVTIGN